MRKVVTIALDIARSVFQVHGINEAGEVAVRQRLDRARVPAFFEKLPRCLVGVEACNTSHYWARELIALGQISPNGTSDQKMSVLAVDFHGQRRKSVFGPKAFRWPRSVERCGR
jgi:hypothetical protein